MPNWTHRVQLKHLFCKEEDHESIQTTMNAIADIIGEHRCFDNFCVEDFREIPQGDQFFGPADYANKMLDAMYDYADENRIWID